VEAQSVLSYEFLERSWCGYGYFVASSTEPDAQGNIRLNVSSGTVGGDRYAHAVSPELSALMTTPSYYSLPSS